MYHSHTYTDPETGELVDVMIADPDDGPEYRNARDGRDHRGGGAGGLPGRRPPWRPHGLPGSRPDRVFVRHPQPRPESGPIAPRPAPVPVPAPMPGDVIAIPKSAIAELIPALGQVWASFLGLPEAPHAIGDDVVDRNNATMHRAALATHTQNQTRILALTDLASRALRLVL